jgi:hypothetical protein
VQVRNSLDLRGIAHDGRACPHCEHHKAACSQAQRRPARPDPQTLDHASLCNDLHSRCRSMNAVVRRLTLRGHLRYTVSPGRRSSSGAPNRPKTTCQSGCRSQSRPVRFGELRSTVHPLLTGRRNSEKPKRHQGICTLWKTRRKPRAKELESRVPRRGNGTRAERKPLLENCTVCQKPVHMHPVLGICL